MNKPSDINWHKCNTSVFWGEIASCDHLVQIYENDDVILDALEGFVQSGLRDGESVIIICTGEHLEALNTRLVDAGVPVTQLIKNNRYLPFDANECLTKFMIHGWPAEHMFNKFVTDILSRARGTENRRVRAYGEMVALLWQKGHNGATVQLEHLWNKFCQKEVFCLFCAYPKSGFTQEIGNSIDHICSVHTKMIAGDVRSTTEIFYKSA